MCALNAKQFCRQSSDPRTHSSLEKQIQARKTIENTCFFFCGSCVFCTVSLFIIFTLDWFSADPHPSRIQYLFFRRLTKRSGFLLLKNVGTTRTVESRGFNSALIEHSRPIFFSIAALSIWTVQLFILATQ